MKAQIITQFGNPSVFQYTDIAKPGLKAGHILVKVCATSVNPIDCKIRIGAVPAISPEFPAILQGDVAGIVEEVASDVKNFSAGDQIFALAGGVRGTGGALAEYMLVDAKAAVKKPNSISMRQAAAIPLVAMTAWTALFNKAGLHAGQNILIHGGLGGVGHMAVQLAKWCGAKVYTTVLSDQDIDMAKSLGADEVINAKQETVTDYVQRLTKGQGFDVVFDTVGGVNLDYSLTAAATEGAVATTVARSTHDLTPMHNKGLSLHVVFVLLPLLSGKCEQLGTKLKKIADVISQEKLKPLIDSHVFSLAEVSEAHSLLESGKAKGKVIVTVSDTNI